MDPSTALTAAIDNASKVANTTLFTTIIDKVTGFKISQWSAEGEVRKKLIHDEYEKAKENGIIGIQYIKNLRDTSNLIETAIKSTKYIDQDKPNEIEFDNDFFWNTIEYSKTISNDDVQDLIAKIIAGEYNQPGTYSMSTLHCLKMLGKNELEAFENIASLCINNSQIPDDIFGLPPSIKPIMNNLKIDFGTLQTLQSLGLFLPNSMTNTMENPLRKNYALVYFDKRILFKPINDTIPSEINFPSYFELSINGKQIKQHLNPTLNEEYFNWLKNNYSINNYESIK